MTRRRPAVAARDRREAAACLANGGSLLPHITTRNEVRDLDAIRQALGERKLSYWGVSYGTYVGAVYATQYPQRTDRVVLDSNDDPDPTRVARGWLANYAIGVEDPLTAGMPVNIGPCAFWPVPAGQPVRVDDHGPANVLLIQNRRAPATPLSGAQRMAAALGRRARMVVVDAGGHGSYLANGNAQGDAAVTAFLAYGRRP